MPCASAILAALRPGYASLPRYCPGGQYARPFFLDSHGIDALGGHFPPHPKRHPDCIFYRKRRPYFKIRIRRITRRITAMAAPPMRISCFRWGSAETGADDT